MAADHRFHPKRHRRAGAVTRTGVLRPVCAWRQAGCPWRRTHRASRSHSVNRIDRTAVLTGAAAGTKPRSGVCAVVRRLVRPTRPDCGHGQLSQLHVARPRQAPPTAGAALSAPGADRPGRPDQFAGTGSERTRRHGRCALVATPRPVGRVESRLFGAQPASEAAVFVVEAAGVVFGLGVRGDGDANTFGPVRSQSPER